MRVPFGLGRRSGSGDETSGDASSAGPDEGPAAAVASAAGRPSPAPAHAWASLPPIQRVTGEMPLVAAPGRFVEGLPGSHELPPIVKPLGHEVSRLATPGLVVARARPIEMSASGAIPTPVQRRASAVARSGTPTMPPATPGTVEDPLPRGAGLGEPTAADEATPAPIRSLPAVSRLTIRMPDRPLTSAAVAARPAVAQRSSAPGTGTPVAATQRGMRRVQGAGVALTPPTVSREAAAPATAAATGQTTTAALPSARGVAAPVRSGLGAPLDALPASALPVGTPPPGRQTAPVVSRSTSTPVLPHVAGPRVSTEPVAGFATAEAHGSTPGPDRGPVPSPATEDRAQLPELPILGVSRSTSRTLATPPAATRPTTAPEPEQRPTLAARPIQRSVQGPRSDATAVEANDSGAHAHAWWAPGDAGETAARSAGPAPDPAPFTAAVAGPPRNADRAAFGGGPAGDHPAARSIRSLTQVARSVQRQTVPQQPALTLVRTGAGRSSQETAAAGSAFGTTSQRPPPEATQIVVQTTASSAQGSSSGPGGASATSVDPVVQRAEQSTPVEPMPSTPRSERSDRDLDELAQALFGRIRGRLRSELILDREAKGLTFDNI